MLEKVKEKDFFCHKEKEIRRILELNKKNLGFLNSKLYQGLGKLVLTVQMTEGTLSNLIYMSKNIDDDVIVKMESELINNSIDDLLKKYDPKVPTKSLAELIDEMATLNLIDYDTKIILHDCRSDRNNFIHRFFNKNPRLMENRDVMIQVIIDVELLSFVLSEYLTSIALSYIASLTVKSEIISNKFNELSTHFKHITSSFKHK